MASVHPSTMIRRMLVSAASVLCLFSLSSSHATPFTIVDTGVDSGGSPGGQDIYEVRGLMEGDAFNLDWSLSAADFPPGFSSDWFPELSATGMVFVDTLNQNELHVRVMIQNTTQPQNNEGEDLSAPITIFGISAPDFDTFAVDPGSHLDTDATPQPSFPGFNGIVDACVTSGQNCAGGDPQTGIDIGESDTFTMQFTGTFGTEVTLDAFAIKWQTNFDDFFCAGLADTALLACQITFNTLELESSFELAGMPSEKSVPPEEIPEPHTLALLGIGLLSLGVRAARREKN